MSNDKMRAYPRNADIKRVIAAARLAGLQVGSVEVRADGSIVILQSALSEKDDFKMWEAKL